MEAIRKFYLKNSDGETLDLNGERFFYNPTGLGTEHKIEYENAGDAFVLIKDQMKQKQIKGTILFKGGYEDYRDFAKFIQATPLTLTYTTDETYYIDVICSNLTKTELDVGGLPSNITLTGLGMFYKPISVRNSATEEGKKYPYVYPYVYKDGTISIIEVNVESVKMCPTRLTIIGPATNPSWSHKVNGVVVGSGKVNVTVDSGNRLVIDDTCNPYSIKIVNSTGTLVADAYQNSDFTTKRFMFLQNGMNEITVTHEGANDINLSLEGKELYETI